MTQLSIFYLKNYTFGGKGRKKQKKHEGAVFILGLDNVGVDCGKFWAGLFENKR